MHIKNLKDSVVCLLCFCSIQVKNIRAVKNHLVVVYYKELDERFKLLFYNLTAGIDYMERTFIPAIEQTSD